MLPRLPLSLCSWPSWDKGSSPTLLIIIPFPTLDSIWGKSLTHISFLKWMGALSLPSQSQYWGHRNLLGKQLFSQGDLDPEDFQMDAL